MFFDSISKLYLQYPESVAWTLMMRPKGNPEVACSLKEKKLHLEQLNDLTA